MAKKRSGKKKLFLIVKISGSGSPTEIARALRVVAKDITDKETLADVQNKGEVEMEDEILFTDLSLGEED